MLQLWCRRLKLEQHFSGSRILKLEQHLSGSRSCCHLTHNLIPSARDLAPDGFKWENSSRNRVEQLFPAVSLKQALRRCPTGPLPIEDGFVLETPDKTNAYEISQIRKQAKGKVLLLLDAIEAAQPCVPPSPGGKRVAFAERPVDRELLVNNLNKLWSPLNTPMLDRYVLGVMQGVRSCTAGMHFFHWAVSQTDFQPSTLTYNGLVEMLMKRNFCSQGLRIYSLMQRESFKKSGCGIDGDTVGAVVRGLLFERPTDAVQVLNDALFLKNMEVADDVIHDVIARMCKSAGMLPLSIRCFHRMKNPGDQTYQVLVRTMSKEQFVYEAYDLIVSMEIGKGFPTDDVTYHLLICEFCRRKELSRAHILLHDFMDRGRIPSVITFNTVLQLLCTKKERDTADKTWKLYLAMKSRGVKLNAVTFSIVLQVLANANRVDQTMIILDEMLRSDCVPGKITGSAVVMALARADRVTEALDLVERMHKEFKHGVGGEAVASTIHGFLRLKPLKQSMLALKKVAGLQFVPELPLFGVIISQLCKEDMLRDAMLQLNEAVAQRGAHVCLYEPLVDGFCNAGKLPMAYKLFQDMIQRGCEPSPGIYKSIITSFTSAKNMSDAFKLVEYMFNKDVYPDEELYETLLEGLQETGNAQAYDILKTALSQSDTAPNEVMFKAVYRLRSCVRPTEQPAPAAKDLDNNKMDDDEELAEVVHELPQAPRSRGRGRVPERFSESESEDDANSPPSLSQVRISSSPQIRIPESFSSDGDD